MTELEAFRHYSESAGPFIDYSSVKRAWYAACEWQRSVCNEELVMLRQRVAELEKLSEAISRDCNDTALERNALQTELAALKQQGEPVAWRWEQDNLTFLTEWHPDTEYLRYETLKALYTAPPDCFSAADMADAQAKAFRSTPDLSAVIAWLENGCDPKEAAKELRSYQQSRKEDK